MCLRGITLTGLVRIAENKNPAAGCGSDPFSLRLALFECLKIKIPQQAAGVILSAEKEGFEPPVPWIQDNGFQDRRIRPLCHFSAAKIIFF